MNGTTLNFFNTDAFNVISMTMAINVIPNLYGRINELGIFTDQGVRTRSVFIERMDGVLNLLPTRPPGAPGSVGIPAKRQVRSFSIPHIPHDDVALPEEVQGVRMFGSESELQTVSYILGLKLAAMGRKHDITLENLRAGALKGLITDADGSTILDLYAEFGLTQTTVAFALANAATDVLGKILTVKRTIEVALKGETMTSIYCLCSPEFYSALTTHPNVAKAFQYYQINNQNLQGDYRSRFVYGGVVFEEYIGQATDAGGGIHKFITASEATFFPLGTQNTFRTWYAPADFNETVNTIGLPKYAKQQPRDFERGIDIHTQSNPLPMCARPELLIRATVA